MTKNITIQISDELYHDLDKRAFALDWGLEEYICRVITEYKLKRLNDAEMARMDREAEERGAYVPRGANGQPNWGGTWGKD